jgi:hypothetical protein
LYIILNFQGFFSHKFTHKTPICQAEYLRSRSTTACGKKSAIHVFAVIEFSPHKNLSSLGKTSPHSCVGTIVTVRIVLMLDFGCAQFTDGDLIFGSVPPVGDLAAVVGDF